MVCGRRGDASELVDAALVGLYGAEASPVERAPRTALVALGGYGRGALVPRSDIDLLLLHDGTESAAVAALSERLLYPLWDAGFTVGHAVRTPDETVALAAERLDAATAVLDARLLAGDAALMRAAVDPGRRPPARRSGWVRREPGERRPGTARALRLDRVPPGTGAEGWWRRAARHPRVRLAPGGPRPVARGRRAAQERGTSAAGRGRGVPDPRAERAPPGERPQGRSAAPRSTGRRRARDGVRGRASAAGGRRLDARRLRARARRGCAHRRRHHPPDPGRTVRRSPSTWPMRARRSRWSPRWPREGGNHPRPSWMRWRPSPRNRSRGTRRAARRSCGSSARDHRRWTDCGRSIGPDCSSARSPSGPTSGAARSATRITATRSTCICFGRSSARLARSPRPTRTTPWRSWRSGLDPGAGRRPAGRAPARRREERRGRPRGGR